MTWNNRMHNVNPWTSPGGDFDATASASTFIDVALGERVWSSAQLAANVQEWITSPAGNDGWVLKSAQEQSMRTGRRFGSREGGSGATLEVGFIPPVDSDMDGMPDEWELLHFGGPTNAVAGADADLDNSINLDEYVADTDPMNSNSFWKVEDITQGSLMVSFLTASGRVYNVQRNDDLTSVLWTDLESGITGDGTIKMVTDTNDLPGRAYRAGVQLAPE